MFRYKLILILICASLASRGQSPMSYLLLKRGISYTGGNGLWLDANNSTSYSGSGTSWVDLSGNSNTGTLTGSPTYTSTSPKNFSFNGSNQYVNIPNATSLNPTTSMTLACWVNFTSFTTNANMINKGYTSVSPPYIQYQLYMGDGGAVATSKPRMVLALGSAYEVDYTSNLSLSTWYYIVGTWDGSNMKIYVNGTAGTNTTATSGTCTAYNTPVSIGRWATQNSQYLNGKISDAEIYNYALTASQITANFNYSKSIYGY